MRARRAAVDGTFELIGKRALFQLGTELGKVDDVMFDPQTGALEKLLVDGTSIRRRRCWATGPMLPSWTPRRTRSRRATGPILDRRGTAEVAGAHQRKSVIACNTDECCGAGLIHQQGMRYPDWTFFLVDARLKPLRRDSTKRRTYRPAIRGGRSATRRGGVPQGEHHVPAAPHPAIEALYNLENIGRWGPGRLRGPADRASQPVLRQRWVR